MNGVPTQPRLWTSRRLWAVVSLVFAAQLTLIFLLSDRKPMPLPAPVLAPALAFAGPVAAQRLALSAPTLFALPHRQGFSGLAWLSPPPATNQSFVWFEPPRWLPLAEQQLGSPFHRFIETNVFDLGQVSAGPRSALTLPALVETESTSERSEVRLAGGLADRWLTAPLDLPSFLRPDFISNSVVQVLVDADGKPVSMTLLDKRSDPEADQRALEAARGARFNPVKGGPPAGATSPSRGLVWGQMIFEWRTVPAPSTNQP